ncbi:Lon protease family protein [Desulfoplanes sp.]
MPKRSFALRPGQLTTRLNPRKLPSPSNAPVGLAPFQPRALHALRLGLHVNTPEYNIYLAGEPGLGRNYLLQKFLVPLAAQAPVPPDRVYTYNFSDQDNPSSLALPPGQGRVLKQGLAQAIKNIRKDLPAKFEHESYVTRHDGLINAYNLKREGLLDDMEAKANAQGFSLNTDEDGSLSLYPLVEGKVLSTDEYERLDRYQRNRLKKQSSAIMDTVVALSRQINREEQEFKEKERSLDREIARSVADHALADLLGSFASTPAVSAYLEELTRDIEENLEKFRESDRPSPPEGPQDFPSGAEQFFRRYEINLFVDNGDLTGAPVIMENNPGFFNLLGCIERETEWGTYYTDFSLIKSGSVHRANGGYLILYINDLLAHPVSWEGLLRCLRSRRLRIEDPTDHYDLVRTKTIEPEPIPMGVKIILIGDDEMYDVLLEQEDRFRKYFKLKAHIQETAVRSEQTLGAYVQALYQIVEESGLAPFTREALARLVDHSSRLAQDQGKLSLQFSLMREVMIEADALRAMRNGSKVSRDLVDEALQESEYRLNLYEEEFLHEYDRTVIKVRTEGTAVGRANGLSVSQIGDYVLGLPHEISCTVGVGHGGILDLEREAELGGPIHTKGMMILKNYLLELFAQDRPLVLTGSLCFEQSYAQVDGDSASGAELATLLSSLANIPIRLNLAFTGALSQSGAILAVGEVTRKIEGFFNVCKRRGLTGDQGVLIPWDNKGHLMLGQEVTRAVEEKMFHIYAVKTIEEAMQILTGTKPGKRLKNGGFSKNSIYAAVDDRLAELAELAESNGTAKRRRKRNRPPAPQEATTPGDGDRTDAGTI